MLLYNDATNDVYLGRKVNHGRGTHFTWENRDIRYNVLRAVGYYDGKPVAEDVLVLKGLERAPHLKLSTVHRLLCLPLPITMPIC